jgi:hypothetical protein
MKIEVVQKETKPKQTRQHRSPVQYFNFISEMPDMNSGPPTNITVVKEEISDYETDITIESNPITTIEHSIPKRRSTNLPYNTRRSNTISNGYNLPEYSGILESEHCIQCNIIWDINALDSSGVCQYCYEGLNGYSVN